MRRIAGVVLCILAFALSAMFVNCSDDSPTKPSHDPVIIPLAVGNVWEYADTVLGPVSAVFSASISITGKTVITHEFIEYDVFIMEHLEEYNQILSTHFVRTDEFGLWELGTACEMDSVTYKHMNGMYPADVGDEWVKGWYQCDPNQNVTGYPPGPARCVSVDSLYTVPAGTFRCHVYHSQHDLTIFGIFDIYTFYAPDVGLVAREIRADIMMWKSALVDYDLN